MVMAVTSAAIDAGGRAPFRPKELRREIQPGAQYHVVIALTATVPRCSHWIEMARYFFHFVENGQHVLDSQGMDLPSADEALAEAEAGARGIMAEELHNGQEYIVGRSIEVTGADGQTFFSVSFDELLAAYTTLLQR
jgi:hypothetical protein